MRLQQPTVLWGPKSSWIGIANWCVWKPVEKPVIRVAEQNNTKTSLKPGNSHKPTLTHSIIFDIGKISKKVGSQQVLYSLNLHIQPASTWALFYKWASSTTLLQFSRKNNMTNKQVAELDRSISQTILVTLTSILVH